MEFGSSSKLSKKRDGSSSLEKTKEKRFRRPYIGAQHRNGKWAAEIRVPKMEKRIWLKYHDTAEAAARAYDFASYHLYGPNGPCNFPNQRSPQGVSQLIDSELAAYILRSIAQYTSVGTQKVPGAKSLSKLSTCHSIDEPVVKEQSDHGAAHKVNPEPIVTSNLSKEEPYMPELDFTSNGFEMEPYFPSFAPEEKPLPLENLPFDDAFIKGSDEWILDFMAEAPTYND